MRGHASIWRGLHSWLIYLAFSAGAVVVARDYTSRWVTIAVVVVWSVLTLATLASYLYRRAHPAPDRTQ